MSESFSCAAALFMAGRACLVTVLSFLPTNFNHEPSVIHKGEVVYC